MPLELAILDWVIRSYTPNNLELHPTLAEHAAELRDLNAFQTGEELAISAGPLNRILKATVRVCSQAREVADYRLPERQRLKKEFANGDWIRLEQAIGQHLSAWIWEPIRQLNLEAVWASIWLEGTEPANALAKLADSEWQLLIAGD